MCVCACLNAKEYVSACVSECVCQWMCVSMVAYVDIEK